MRARTTFAVASLLLTATACSSTASPAAPAAPPAASIQPTAAASAPSSPSAKAFDAAAVTAKIAKAIPSVKLTVTYDATSDPNGKLGRPHQYSSKTAFDDTRVSNDPKAKDASREGRRDGIAYGGTVEVFPTVEDAEAWVKYIDGVGKALGSLVTPDYVYRQGAVVVRVSRLLTPEQAAGFEKAIG